MRYTTAAFSKTVLQTGLVTAEYSLKKQQSTNLHIFEPAFISGLNLFIKTVQNPAKKQQLPSSAFFFLYFSFYAKEKSRLRRTCFTGAEDEIRTRDPRLGKAMLYH